MSAAPACSVCFDAFVGFHLRLPEAWFALAIGLYMAATVASVWKRDWERTYLCLIPPVGAIFLCGFLFGRTGMVAAILLGSIALLRATARARTSTIALRVAQAGAATAGVLVLLALPPKSQTEALTFISEGPNTITWRNIANETVSEMGAHEFCTRLRASSPASTREAENLVRASQLAGMEHDSCSALNASAEEYLAARPPLSP